VNSKKECVIFAKCVGRRGAEVSDVLSKIVHGQFFFNTFSCSKCLFIHDVPLKITRIDGCFSLKFCFQLDACLCLVFKTGTQIFFAAIEVPAIIFNLLLPFVFARLRLTQGGTRDDLCVFFLRPWDQVFFRLQLTPWSCWSPPKKKRFKMVRSN
jgi:hypothetical protein